MFQEVKIDIRKLRDYCLNPNHPVGKHKARVFASHLGIERRDAGLLKQEITKAIKKAGIQTERENKFGKIFQRGYSATYKKQSCSR